MKLKSLGDEELRKEYETKVKELFKEHNISEDDGFELANKILEYALSLKDKDEQK